MEILLLSTKYKKRKQVNQNETTQIHFFDSTFRVSYAYALLCLTTVLLFALPAQAAGKSVTDAAKGVVRIFVESENSGFATGSGFAIVLF